MEVCKHTSQNLANQISCEKKRIAKLHVLTNEIRHKQTRNANLLTVAVYRVLFKGTNINCEAYNFSHLKNCAGFFCL